MLGTRYETGTHSALMQRTRRGKAAPEGADPKAADEVEENERSERSFHHLQPISLPRNNIIWC